MATDKDETMDSDARADETTGRLGIALRDLPLDAVEQIAERAEAAGFTDLFIPETGQILRDPVDGRDPFMAAGVALGATTQLRAGPGIAGTVFRSARHMAIAAATVHEVSGGRFILGCGVSHRSLAEALGMRFPRSPLGHAAAYCDELRQLADGGLAFGNGFEVMLAARGDKMVQVASAHSDGVLLTWLTPEESVRVRALVDEAAPQSRETALLVRVGDEDSLLADADLYGNHLPGYDEHFRRQGLEDHREVIDRACLRLSSAADVREGLEGYRAAGVTLPCLYPSGMSPEQIVDLLDDWQAMSRPSPSGGR